MDTDSDDIKRPRYVGNGLAQSVRYSDEDRDLAYQLWAYQYSQDAMKVCNHLGAMEFPILVTDRTLRRWVENHKWHERIRQDLKSVAPAIHESNVLSIFIGAREAINFLREQTRGETVPSGPRTQGAGMLLVAAGYHGRGDRSVLESAMESSSRNMLKEDFQLLSDEELFVKRNAG